MPLEQSNLEDIENPDPLKQYQSFLSNRPDDHSHNRLLSNWLKYGEGSARRFCINDAYKFIDKETIRRLKAGLPPLPSYEDPV